MNHALLSLAPAACASLLLYGSVAMAANPTSSGSCEDGAANMADVRACLSERNKNQVKEAYAALSVKIKARMPQASAALEESQRNWVLFARNSCDFYAEFNAESMLREDARSNCWTDFTRARTKVLKAWEMQLDKRP
ncbi:MAG: DUF1311 domain-containing protein [Burkholderiaceae bacterium]|jgi:uncharacterized protein YecT (DUF1311 family)|nr:DUF1311 domain-containing protein [Burkholderiaceae bacterium]